MGEEESWNLLDDSGVHVLRVIAKYERGLRDFVIVYSVKEGDKDEVLARFDCAHGFAHRDLAYLPRNHKGKKVPVEGVTMKEKMARALDDVKRNWARYYLESKRWRK